jgi:LPPG:FO 2-phospho-L-lactate transferase
MKIVALAGGVGGAKLANGLSKLLPPDELTVIVNTGDDFVHLGLYICPDIDTVAYTLAGVNNPITGWGRENETWEVHLERERNGFPVWFRLGDKDLALHLERTRLSEAGRSLTEITQKLTQALGVTHTILPMTNSIVRTMVNTQEMGKLPFQEYFVKYRFQPQITSIEFEGIENANISQEVSEALFTCDAVIICPSNPFVSINPILSILGFRDMLKKKTVVAVSPIIGGLAVKGPAAKMFTELGIIPSSANVANFYRDVINGFVYDKIDQLDEKVINQWGIISLVTDTLMIDTYSQKRLAMEVINFCSSLMEGSEA